MDTTILEVALGLVLIYALMALLVTTLQEVVIGAFSRDRTRNLHHMLDEVLRHDRRLKQDLLNQPLVQAMYQGSQSEPGLMRASGPGELDAQTFTQALLVTLAQRLPAAQRVNTLPGDHPSQRWATPQAFMDALSDNGSGASDHVVSALRGLLPGRSASWPDFEAAIAQWYEHAGDRARGWYKRRALGWTLVLGTGLTVALNADTGLIASRLGQDPQTRSALAGIAREVAYAQGGAASTPRPADTPAELPPLARFSAGIVDAQNQLLPALTADKSLAAFAVKTNDKDKDRSLAASQALNWLRTLPIIRAQVERALTQTGCDQSATASSACTPPSPADAACDWPAGDPLRGAHGCLINLSVWVAAATTASTDPAVQQAMQRAAVALERSKQALAELRLGQTDQNVLALFEAQPDRFARCAAAATSPADLRQCLAPAAAAFSRIPLGWRDDLLTTQWCSVVVGTAAQARHQVGSHWGCDAAVAANPKLGLPAMGLEPDGARALLRVLGGYALTVLAISLGAPYWFDLLGRVAQLRAGGATQRERAAQAAGAGTQPLPELATRGSTGDQRVSGSPPSGPLDNAPAGEAPLTEREWTAVQQRLNVPATGQPDGATRQAIRAYNSEQGLPGGDALSAQGYALLIGRETQALAQVLASSGTVPTLGHAHPQAAALAQALMRLTGFPGRIPVAQQAIITADTRAMAVLWQLKQQVGAAPAPGALVNAQVVQLADSQPASLDIIDPVAAILDPAAAVYARLAAPWMDWALGELGVLEQDATSRAASNPRICTYLDSASAGLGDSGDHTAWCGAFVAWVVKQHNAALLAAPALPAPPAAAARAASWQGWGTAVASGLELLGDVVLLLPQAPGTSGHVGFCVHQDATHVWLLAGNQRKGSRAAIERYPRGQVVYVGRG